MAHNLSTFNGRAAMMFAGAKPWHGLGVEVPDAVTAEEAIQHAGLDWEVQSQPVYFSADARPAEQYQALVRADTRRLLSIQSDGYKIIQNREAFRFFDSVVGSKDAKYVTAGALGAGERIWMLAEVSRCPIMIAGQDEVKPFILLSTSHDGTAALRMLFTPVRVVCQNTLNAALGKGAGGVSIRHTANAMGRVDEARRALGIALKYYDTFEQEVQTLASKQIGRAGLRQYFETLVPDNEKADSNTRTQNIRGRMEYLFEYGKGQQIPGVRGSLWAAYNAVTEYVDHDRTTRGATQQERASNRLESIWLGSGARMKEEAFELALTTAAKN